MSDVYGYGGGAYYPFLPATTRAPLAYGSSVQGGGETGPIGGTNDNALRQFINQGGGGQSDPLVSRQAAQALANAIRGPNVNLQGPTPMNYSQLFGQSDDFNNQLLQGLQGYQSGLPSNLNALLGS